MSLFGCFSEDLSRELQNVTLSDITVIATLGVGGFGRVELVKINLRCCVCKPLYVGSVYFLLVKE